MAMITNVFKDYTIDDDNDDNDYDNDDVQDRLEQNEAELRHLRLEKDKFSTDYR